MCVGLSAILPLRYLLSVSYLLCVPSHMMKSEMNKWGEVWQYKGEGSCDQLHDPRADNPDFQFELGAAVNTWLPPCCCDPSWCLLCPQRPPHQAYAAAWAP